MVKGIRILNEGFDKFRPASPDHFSVSFSIIAQLLQRIALAFNFSTHPDLNISNLPTLFLSAASRAKARHSAESLDLGSSQNKL